MIGTSTADYVHIRFWILILHNVVLVSLGYCALLIFSFFLSPALLKFRLPLPIELWIFAEAAFYFLFYLPYKYRLQRPAAHPERMPQKERQEFFAQCLDNVSDPEKFLRQWFLGARIEDIKRDNLEEFILWAFFNTADKTAPEDEQEMEGYIRTIEKMLGREIPPGRGKAKCLRLTIDKVDFMHRSLLWYFCVFFVDSLTFCSMLYNGFHFHRTVLTQFFKLFPFRPLTLLSPHKSPVPHLTYWHRPHTSKTKLPVLFIHGIGIGLYPYTNFLRDLDSASGIDSSVGIIALEIMSVSFRITTEALDKDAMVREIYDIVQSHGWNRFILVSHSYGSIISTHLLKSSLTSPLIGPVVFIDPVSFLLHLPDVAYNFTAREPHRANEHQLWYFGSKDIGVAHTLARRFFWSQNLIWKEDLGLEGENGRRGRNVTVVLSGRDLIVNTEAVRRYLATSSSHGALTNGSLTNGALTNGEAVGGPLPSKMKASETRFADEAKGLQADRQWTGSGLDVLWFEKLDHAQVFDAERTRRPLIEAIGVYSARG